MPVMTVGEMLGWTKRFNQIRGAAQALKHKRLAKLRDDLAQAYEGKQYDPHSGYLFAAISEEMGA